MTYKDILVHIDRSKSNAGRLEAAVKLAEAHQAHLTGLYVIPDINLPVYAEIPIGQELIDSAEQAALEDCAEAKEEFTKAVKSYDLSTEWRETNGLLLDSIALNGRYVDLVIVGQTDEDDETDFTAGLAHSLVLESGPPVLVIPYIGTTQAIGEKVMVAWNASREAVRAVNDALPILRGAKKVEVYAVNPKINEHEHGEIPSADICLHLSRHGVNAEAHHIVAKDIDVGDMLLSRAADFDIDLIVMGAYGRSRIRELVLGGATRHLLNHATVPVLLAH
ncbi:universal stress protein [Pseudomonadota bacterium]